jgi:hypothetical protein
MGTATASISFHGSGQVTIWTKDGETKDDLLNLSPMELSGRITDFMDVVNNCLDDDDIELDDISLDT